jgi:hypothetical protein
MRLAAILAPALLVVACGSSSSNGTSGGESCGITLSWKKDQATCQAWMDQNCCSQERTCAADSACAAWVACINACATPRQDSCKQACGARPASFDTASSCSKDKPPAVATSIPGDCEWP